MGNIFDAFLTRCVRDSVGPATVPDATGDSTTTEPDHTHICPACDSSWRHANDGCEAGAQTPFGFQYDLWAKCPMHERRDE